MVQEWEPESTFLQDPEGRRLSALETSAYSSCSLKHQAGDEMWNSTAYGGVRQEQSHTSNNHSRGPRQEGIKLKANPQDMGKGGT